MKLMTKQHLTMFSLFLVIVLDVLGLCLVFPLLTPLFFDATIGVLPAGTSMQTRGLFYGLAMSFYPLFMFIGAPIMGDFSDRIGRKKTLLICLLGTSFGYQCAALGVEFHMVWLLLLGRALTGIFAGSQPVAQAAMVDLSPAGKKAVNLSLITLAGGLGVVIGPILGGLTADSDISSYFTLTTPFVIGAILALLNTALLMLTFQETFVRLKSTSKLILHKGIHLFLDAFKNKQCRVLSIGLLFLQFGWGLYIQAILWFMSEQFNYTTSQLSFFVSICGVAFMLSSTVVVRILLRTIKNEARIAVYLSVLMMIALYGAAFTRNETAQWVLAFSISLTQMVPVTMFITLFSNTTDANNQGWIMGITGAVQAAAWAFTALLIGPLGNYDISIPLYLSGIMLTISTAVQFYYLKVAIPKSTSNTL